MAKVSTTFEKAIKLKDGSVQNQVLVISATANSRDEARELPYEAFAFDLFINGKFIADISHVLAKTGVFEDLIDSEDWERCYAEAKADEADYRSEDRKVHVTVHEQISY